MQNVFQPATSNTKILKSKEFFQILRNTEKKTRMSYVIDDNYWWIPCEQIAGNPFLLLWQPLTTPHQPAYYTQCLLLLSIPSPSIFITPLLLLLSFYWYSPSNKAWYTPPLYLHSSTPITLCLMHSPRCPLLYPLLRSSPSTPPLAAPSGYSTLSLSLSRILLFSCMHHCMHHRNIGRDWIWADNR